jgi:heme oxygenase
MMPSALRAHLRDATRAAHDDLDRSIARLGFFECRDGYGRYLQRSYAFRAHIEDWFAAAKWPDAFEHWRPTWLRNALEADLADLGLKKTTLNALERSSSPMSYDIASLAGASYVCEGASLGSRVLLIKARRLGVSANSGARHLACHAENLENWKCLVSLLDRLDLDSRERMQAAGAAVACFAKAKSLLVNHES